MSGPASDGTQPPQALRHLALGNPAVAVGAVERREATTGGPARDDADRSGRAEAGRLHSAS